MEIGYKKMRKYRAKIQAPKRNKFYLANKFILARFYAKKATISIFKNIDYKPIYMTAYLKKAHELAIEFSNDCKVEFDILDEYLIDYEHYKCDV